MSSSFVLYVNDAGEHRWRLTGGNGEIIAASSEGFSSERRALGNARLTAEQLTMHMATRDEQGGDA